jgi:hypothetical protein
VDQRLINARCRQGGLIFNISVQGHKAWHVSSGPLTIPYSVSFTSDKIPQEKTQNQQEYKIIRITRMSPPGYSLLQVPGVTYR